MGCWAYHMVLIILAEIVASLSELGFSDIGRNKNGFSTCGKLYLAFLLVYPNHKFLLHLGMQLLVFSQVSNHRTFMSLISSFGVSMLEVRLIEGFSIILPMNTDFHHSDVVRPQLDQAQF